MNLEMILTWESVAQITLGPTQSNPVLPQLSA